MLRILVPLALAGCTAGVGVSQQNDAGTPGPTPAAAPAAPAPANVRAISDVGDLPENCPLILRFGSYAMGIDRGAAAAVEALLTSHGDVAQVLRQRWGREGEITLCALLRPGAGPAPLMAAIEPLLPAKPRGPIDVIAASGERISAPRR